jgi:hypothetical protein
MFDPTVGRWLEEDSIGFEGGDANLYRFVGNDPTNATDPTGMEARTEILNPGEKVDPAKFGGGNIAIAQGPHGQLQVNTKAAVRRFDPELSDRVLKMTPEQLKAAGIGPLQYAKITRGVRADDCISITFTAAEGTDARDLQFVQFVWWEATLTNTRGQKRRLKTSTATSTVKDARSTYDYLPTWYVDSASPGPAYEEQIRTKQAITMFDAPGPDVLLLNLLDDLVRAKREQLYTRAAVVFHFETYLLYDGRPIYSIPWTSTSTWDGNGKAWPEGKISAPVIDVTGGGPTPPALNGGQIRGLQRQYPNQKLFKPEVVAPLPVDAVILEK